MVRIKLGSGRRLQGIEPAHESALTPGRGIAVQRTAVGFPIEGADSLPHGRLRLLDGAFAEQVIALAELGAQGASAGAVQGPSPEVLPNTFLRRERMRHVFSL